MKYHPQGFMLFEIIQGPEAKCLTLNSTRIAGPKPWAGGTLLASFEVGAKTVYEAAQKQMSKCDWTILNRADEVWSTDCSNQLRMRPHNFKYCPYCSKEIEWKEV